MNGTTALPRRSFGETMRRRCLVDAAAARFYRIVDFYRLFHVGGISGKRLFLWQLHLAVLLAGNLRRFAAQLVWT